MGMKLGRVFEANLFAFYERCEASGQFVQRYRVSFVLLKFLFAVDRLAEAIFVACCAALLFFICMIAALLCATVNSPRILFAAVRYVCGRDHGEGRSHSGTRPAPKPARLDRSNPHSSAHVGKLRQVAVGVLRHWLVNGCLHMDLPVRILMLFDIMSMECPCVLERPLPSAHASCAHLTVRCSPSGQCAQHMGSGKPDWVCPPTDNAFELRRVPGRQVQMDV